MNASILKAKGISKNFYTPSLVEVLKEVDLEIDRGQSIAIIGKSGEGKSTLLHILGTLEKPCSGSLEICGQDTAKAVLGAVRNVHVGFIFQSYHLFDEDTVLDNVLLPAKIGRHDTKRGTPIYERALMLLDAVGMRKRAGFLAKLLSGGEKQRVAIARALINDPDLIIADEPSGNLDHAHSAQIHALLLRLVREFNKGLIVATHDRELSSLCDRILQLKDGVLS